MNEPKKILLWLVTILFLFSFSCGSSSSNNSNDNENTTNNKPMANAGADQSVETGMSVTLDGSASSDQDNDALTYIWTLTPPSGSSAVLAGSTTANPTFTPDIAGTYTASLVVNDGTADSLSDSVTITVTDPATNNIPVANAGADQSVETGMSVTLDGSASSDQDGDALTYIWTLITPSGSSAVLAGSTTANPTFTPDIAGTYTASLIVNDGTADSLSDSVTITVTDPATNNIPVANAGADQSVETGMSVTLDGSASSDQDGDALTYIWTLTPPSGSSAVLAGSTTANPTFTPDIAGTYTASLVVNDGTADSLSDSVTITVTDPATNNIPVANAGADQSVETGMSVTLDGSASSDQDGDALTYIWTLITPSGSSAVLAGSTTANPTFTPDIAGTYTASLVVNDGTADSLSDSVAITVTDPTTVSFSNDIQPIFDSRCIICHTPSGSAPFLILESGSSYNNLVNISATQSSGTRVIPGDASSSILYLRISGTTVGLMMPLGGPALSTTDQDLIKNWINEGADNN